MEGDKVHVEYCTILTWRTSKSLYGTEKGDEEKETSHKQMTQQEGENEVIELNNLE